ncbi:class I SAM-dependent methyltransferase [Vallitalea sp.]|jgi:ubiquinone/menaquinone biosynthesis C-methylase UbiE|uniref:class I SAM-dependent methyltransferase n=1 Tax=Vallitalea sp. TaxID=1882829 RepID=UPI0025D48E87|nr:methyltransferase domain-containing protein [Vallitalea sp.]MCT4686723.1 methyltransferase domain-containing protein [Vallitalea sp.]
MKNEQYSAGYNEELIRLFKNRSVYNNAKFFIPYLKNGDTILDCGSGPGTITVGLAKTNPQSHVFGIDISLEQIETARKYAEDQNVTNVIFQKGNVKNLPFEDNYFDSVFAHALLQHLANPIHVLSEIHRVLKPGGVVGIRDDDQGSLILSPYTEKMERLFRLFRDYKNYCGGDAYVGRKQKYLLREAGFSDIIATASCEYDSTFEQTNKRAIIADKLLSHMNNDFLKLGWTTKEEILELSKTVKEWGKNQDAFDVIVWCEAVGYKKC